MSTQTHDKIVRFIFRRVHRDQGHVMSGVLTVDANCPEVFDMLNTGGFGGGPDGDDFEYTELFAAELRRDGK